MPVRRRWIAAAIAAAVTIVIVVDRLEVAKPSPVAAVACTGLLVTPRDIPSDFLARHRTRIRAASANHDLPVTLVAAVIADHLRQQTAFRNYTDCAGSALGANLSLGPGQIRLSTAAALQGDSYPQLSASAYRHLRAQLLAPEKNIDLTAKELRALLERRHRYPGISARELLREPQAMALAVSEYRMGRSNASRDIARLGINAFGTLSLMQSGELDYLETVPAEDADKAHIKDYLRYIHCESGLFNEVACSDWVTAQAKRPRAASPEAHK